ncbi:MAG: hypothetical protein L0Y72_26630 [Gemmataceae bacterium]|nr:hypothetical protein [Gemmataceae bacterium]
MVEFLLSFLVWLITVAAFWLALRTLVNRLSGLQGRLPVDTGPVLRQSRWGEAKVNGMGFQECVRVVECRNGWLIQAHWLLGGGQLWLPRAQTWVGQLEHAGWLSGTSRTLKAGTDRVTLEGELAEVIDEPAVPDVMNVKPRLQNDGTV